MVKERKDPKKRTIMIDTDVWKEMKQISLRDDKSLNELVRTFVDVYKKNHITSSE